MHLYDIVLFVAANCGLYVLAYWFGHSDGHAIGKTDGLHQALQSRCERERLWATQLENPCQGRALVRFAWDGDSDTYAMFPSDADRIRGIIQHGIFFRPNDMNAYNRREDGGMDYSPPEERAPFMPVVESALR